MSSAVDISNLALSHLGANGTISSINPPEGSTNAIHAARFYPMARDALLEAFPWNFSTRRAQPGSLTSETNSYVYAYQLPSNALRVFAVQPPDVNNDYLAELGVLQATDYLGERFNAQPIQMRVPQNFSLETLDDGTKIVYTNVQNAVIRYAVRIEDTSKFSPLFVLTLSRLLASQMAGPVVKGERGIKIGAQQYQIFLNTLARAETSDANQSKQYISFKPIWMSDR